MIYLASNIKYDTDNEDVNLPKEIEINVPDDIKGVGNIVEFISDEITEITSFLVIRFTFQTKEQ